MLRRLWFVAVSSCGAQSTPNPVANNAGPERLLAVQSVCPPTPLSAGLEVAPWTHELFAGCPTAQFPYDFAVCNGECPRPCRTIVHNGSTTQTATFAYDARGRWLSTTAADGPSLMYRGACTYDGDALATCNRVTMRRDGRRRLVSVVDDGHDIEIHWSGDRVAEIYVDKKQFRYGYDAHGGLISFDSNQYVDPTHVTWRYRDDGRPSGRIENEIQTTYAYDATGRLARVDVDMPEDPAYGKTYQKIALAYDTSYRLISETTIDSPSLGSDVPSTTSRTFEYSCPR